MKKRLTAITIIFSIILTSAVNADNGTNSNTPEIIKQLEKAANAGSPQAMNKLAKIYLNSKEAIDQATMWARRSAKTGDREGQYLVFDSISMLPESLTANKIKTEAYTMLSLSAEQGFLPAKQRALALLSSRNAPKNRAKLIALARGMKNPPPELKKDIQDTAALQKLGESYISIAYFRYMNPITMRSLHMGAKQKTKSCTNPHFKLISTEISSPIAQAAYLPIGANLLKDMYLIGGTWQEAWIYDGCGKKWLFIFEFTIDKLGCIQAITKKVGISK